jgi:hypothetical protein
MPTKIFHPPSSILHPLLIGPPYEKSHSRVGETKVRSDELSA